MHDRLRIDALRLAQHLAEAMRHAAAGIDRRTAPDLGADLVRTVSLIVASLNTEATSPATLARRLATATATLAELQTLLAMAIGLEVLGVRGPRIADQLGQLRQLLSDLRRRVRESRDSHAA